MKKNFLMLLTACFISWNVFATVKLPQLFADNMVLQRDKPITIWGWANKNEKIEVSFLGKKYNSKTNTSGNWKIVLQAAAYGGPYTMTIKGESNTIELQNILIGDVWLCSGQSNMEFPMSREKPIFPDEVANSSNPNIREFSVVHAYSFSPKTDVAGKWAMASPATTGKFSAVGYYLAKALYDKYKIPIGIIHSSVGGTPAEAWTSEEGLKGFDKYIEKAKFFQVQSNLDSVLAQNKNLPDAWYEKVNEEDKGLQEKWQNPAYEISSWKNIQFPGCWEDQGEKDLDGAVWVRKEIDLTEDMIKQDAVLHLGLISNIDNTYFNGQLIGKTNNRWAERIYKVPATIMKPGKNVIVVRIINTDNYGGFNPKNKNYIYDYSLSFVAGNHKIPLEGQWKYAIGAKMEKFPKSTVLEEQPTGLYNAMIAPLIPYAIKGIAWYQGENNAHSHQQAIEYRKLLPDMINDWRLRWNEKDLPFLIVQIANYTPEKNIPEESYWAELREAQLFTSQKMTNVGLTVTIDIGDADDIHPLDKRTVGNRLALAAENIAYKEKNIVYGGPIYQSMETEGNKIILSFSNVSNGLEAKNGELKRFAIAGSDKKFVWAIAKIEGDKVVVWNNDIPNPVAVRYAWATNPAGCNLYNKNGLPASPFRTDNWTNNK